MLHCSPQRCLPAALSTPGKSRTPSLQPGSMPASLVTKPGKPSASPKEDLMDKTLPRHFHAPGCGCCSPCCGMTLPCLGGSIPSQRDQAHPSTALPSWKESASALSPCSFYYCKISPSCLTYFQLVTVCPPSTSTLFPTAQPLPVLLQSRGLGCDTCVGYTIRGIRVAPHRCLPHSVTILPAAWPQSHPGPKSLHGWA